MSAWADRCCERWAAVYTRGLPAEDARRRREELASDLFEHHRAVGDGPAQQLEVFGRVLWGIPADLSWRRAALAPRERRLQTGATMTLRKLATGLVVLVALWNVWAGIGVFFLGDGVAGVTYLIGFWSGAALIAVGLWRWNDSPRLGSVLLIVGAAVPVAIFYWMAPIFVPLWILVTALVIAAEPGRRPAPAAAL